MIASARERMQLRGLSRGGGQRLGLHAMTCRYTMIANKADDRAIPRVCSFNRKSVGARIWDIPLKKDALVRDRRSIATSEFTSAVTRPYPQLFVRRASVSRVRSGCAYAVRSREGQPDVFVFVRQLVVCCRLTAVISAASLNCEARSGWACSKVNRQPAFAHAGVDPYFAARCRFATPRQIQTSMNNRNLNLGRWGFTLANCVDRRILLASGADKLRFPQQDRKNRFADEVNWRAVPARRAGGRRYLLNPTRFAA
jgi:hypothetical protein